MATIAIKQPNGLFMMFSSVSSSPVEMNLTRDEFIKLYVDLEKDCSYKTPEQSLQDAVETIDEHLYPWEEFYDRYVPMYREDDEEETELERIERVCSKEPKKWIRRDKPLVPFDTLFNHYFGSDCTDDCGDTQMENVENAHCKGIEIKPFHFSTTNFLGKNIDDTTHLFSKAIDDYIEECVKVTSTIICDCFKDYLGCKSGEELCDILSTVQFIKYNEIVDLINENLKYAFSTSYQFAPQLSGITQPIELDDNSRKLIVDMWNDVYPKEKEHESN